MRSVAFSTACLVALSVLSNIGSTSARPSPSDKVLDTRGPSPVKPRAPVPSAPAKRAPAPSAAARRHEARAPVPSSVKRSMREQEPIIPSGDFSRALCPESLSVCPITPSATVPTSLLQWIQDGFECVDFEADLTSCGGCGILDTKHDCTAIPGALGVSCVVGSCHIDSCANGFALASDGKSCQPTH